MSDTKMKAKIEKLLAKAEGTDNAAEAQAFSEMAEKLMVKWGIEAAELEAAGEVKAEEIIQLTRSFKSVYAINLVQLGTDIAMGLGNLKPLVSTRKYNDRTLYLVGHKSDVEAWEMLFNSLSIQAMSALKQWQRAEAEYRQWMSGWEKAKANRQFLLSFSHTVGGRLKAMRQEVRHEASTGAELVLVSKAERIDSYIEDRYGELRQTKSRMHGTHEGRAAGRAAGERASLGEKSVGSRAAVTR